MQARFYKKSGNILECQLCPHLCHIHDGKDGFCRIRHNSAGDMTLPYYGKLTALAMDPIEKKPLYHFFPGSKILSAGFAGCSFRCPFCQNYSISQFTERAGRYVPPEELVSQASASGSVGIAYTYSEPTIHIEYIMDTARLARRKGLKNVLITNGYLNREPAEELLTLIDAANVDLKCWSDSFYRKELKGGLEPVTDFIRMAADRIHLEVTTLVIPGKNSDEEEITAMSTFLAGLSPDIPYHLSCYYPVYKYDTPATTVEYISRLADSARKRVNYVYLGNAGAADTNSYCPECGNLLVRRRGYTTDSRGIKKGRCRQCGTSLPFVLPADDS